MKFLAGLWERTPNWLVALIVAAGSGTYLAAEYGEQVRGLWHRGVEVPPGEWAALQEDKRHGGKVPKFLMADDKVSVAYYDPGCIRVEHTVGDRHVRSWSPHPVEFAPPPPDHAPHYGEVRGAGLIGAPSCAPEETCWYPLAEHPGIFDSAIVGENATDDRCWSWRLMEAPDSCRWEIPYSYCTGEWAWNSARWYCCRRHR